MNYPDGCTVAFLRYCESLSLEECFIFWWFHTDPIYPYNLMLYFVQIVLVHYVRIYVQVQSTLVTNPFSFALALHHESCRNHSFCNRLCWTQFRSPILFVVIWGLLSWLHTQVWPVSHLTTCNTTYPQVRHSIEYILPAAKSCILGLKVVLQVLLFAKVIFWYINF